MEQLQKEVDSVQALLPAIDEQLSQWSKNRSEHLPHIQIWQGDSGIQSALGDMLTYTTRHQFLRMKLIASNTLEMQHFSDHRFQTPIDTFHGQLDKA